MDIGILSTRTGRYHPNRRLLEAASKMGHRALLVHPKRCLIGVGRSGLSLSFMPELPWMPQVILPRIGSTIDEYELAVVKQLEEAGVPLVNGFQALAVARDKFLSLQSLCRAGIDVPKTFLLSEPRPLGRAVEEAGGYPVVFKMMRGRQGRSVILVGSRAVAEYLLEHRQNQREGLLVQQYIREAEGRDIRVLVIGGKVVASLLRSSTRGEFRSNIALRGKGSPLELPADYAKLAIRSARVLGLEIAGVDIIESSRGPLVIEVNTNPGFRELERVTGIDVAERIIGHAVQVAGGGDAG